jgi:hypothetical protein
MFSRVAAVKFDILPSAPCCLLPQCLMQGTMRPMGFAGSVGMFWNFMKRALIAIFLTLLPHTVKAADNEAWPALPSIEVYLPGLCLACIDWADHLRENGFTVVLTETADMPALKRRLKVPAALESVHTAMVGGYFIEGHVSADDIKLLLLEKPKARGLAVPGLPAGAPGREVSNPVCETACTILDGGSAERQVRREMYNTLLVAPNGKTSVFARH